MDGRVPRDYRSSHPPFPTLLDPIIESQNVSKGNTRADGTLVVDSY